MVEAKEVKKEVKQEVKFYYSNHNLVGKREKLGYKKISCKDAVALGYEGDEDPALVLMVK